MELFTNRANTTLNGAINNSTTSVVVTDGSVFPSTGNFRIVIDSEIMLVTARSTNTLTVTRGYESTTAASHSDGSNVALVITNGSLRQLMADYNQSGVFASRPSAGFDGRIYTPTDTPWITHSRDNGSNWINFYRSKQLTAPPTGSWTSDNFSTITQSNERDALVFSIGTTGPSGYSSYHRALPSAPYTIEMGYYIMPQNKSSDNSRNDQVFTMQALLQSSLAMADFEMLIENAVMKLGHYKWNSLSSFSGTYRDRDIFGMAPPVMFLKLNDDNTNRNWSFSPDGIEWNFFYKESRTDHITADRIGIGMAGPSARLAVFHYKES